MRFEQFSNKYKLTGLSEHALRQQFRIYRGCSNASMRPTSKLISLQQHSIMEQSSPMDFLTAHGLKVCK